MILFNLNFYVTNEVVIIFPMVFLFDVNEPNLAYVKKITEI